MEGNGNNGWQEEFDRIGANEARQLFIRNGNAGVILNENLEAGASASSPQVQAGSTPPQNAQQARQGVFDAFRVRNTGTNEPAADVRADHSNSQWAQEEGKEEYIRIWFENASKAQKGGASPDRVLSGGGAATKFESSRTSSSDSQKIDLSEHALFGMSPFPSPESTGGLQTPAPATLATRGGQNMAEAGASPTPDPVGGIAEHALVMSPFPSPAQSPR